MTSAKTGLVLLLVLLVGLCALLLLGDRPSEGDLDRLVLHCAAGMRVPVEEIVEKYNEECGVEVAVLYGGSGQLATQLKVAGGDLSHRREASGKGELTEVTEHFDAMVA